MSDDGPIIIASVDDFQQSEEEAQKSSDTFSLDGSEAGLFAAVDDVQESEEEEEEPQESSDCDTLSLDGSEASDATIRGEPVFADDAAEGPVEEIVGGSIDSKPTERRVIIVVPAGPAAEQSTVANSIRSDDQPVDGIANPEETLVDDRPCVHFQSPDGEFHVCAIDQAHQWLKRGYFTSMTAFVFAPRETEVASDDEWRKWTLGELIERNGYELPLVMLDEGTEERCEMLEAMVEDATNIRTMRLEVEESLGYLECRLDDVREAMRQMKMRLELRLHISSRLSRPDNPVPSMPNPFAEMPADDLESMKKLALRTAMTKMLKIEKNRAVPLNGINPAHILCPYKAKATVGDDEQDTVTPYAKKLAELFAVVDKDRLRSLVEGQLKITAKIPRCAVCAVDVSTDPCNMLEHIVSEAHVERMIDRCLVYQEETLAYWMHTLRMAEKGAAWLPEEEFPTPAAEEKACQTEEAQVAPASEKLPTPLPKDAHQKDDEEVRVAPVDNLLVDVEGINASSFADYVHCLQSLDLVKSPNMMTDPDLPEGLCHPLTLVPSPFAEILHPYFEKNLFDRLCKNSLVVRIHNKWAIPFDAVNPFDVLNPIPAVPGPVELTVLPYVNKLRELVNECDSYHFQALINHQELAKVDEEPFCMLCNSVVMHGRKMPFILLKHMTSDAHVAMMLTRFSIHPLSPLAYWMLVLRIAKRDAPWFPLADTLLSPTSAPQRCRPSQNFDPNSPEFRPNILQPFQPNFAFNPPPLPWMPQNFLTPWHGYQPPPFGLGPYGIPPYPPPPNGLYGTQQEDPPSVSYQGTLVFRSK